MTKKINLCVLFGGESTEYEISLRSVTSVLENLDKDFIGAYMYLPCADGGKELYLMTKKQVMTAWSKSPSNQGVHKQFASKMIEKTVINTGCNKIINSTPSLASYSEENETPMSDVDEQYNDTPEYVEVEEVVVEEPVKVDTPKVAEVAEEPIALAKPPKEDIAPNNDDFDF